MRTLVGRLINLAAEIIGKIVTGYLADLLGRRAMWIVSGVLTAVYLPVLVSAATPDNVPYLLLIFGLLYGAPYAINSTYLSESFPAGVRGTQLPPRTISGASGRWRRRF